MEGEGPQRIEVFSQSANCPLSTYSGGVRSVVAPQSFSNLSLQKNNSLLGAVFMHPMAQLIHRALEDIIEFGGQYALVDFPNYSNVGDSAIWLGAVDHLRRRKARVRYSGEASHTEVEMLGAFFPVGTILLQGGGNFGDLWEHHQAFRESLLLTYQEHRVIQLPQSIHFQDDRRFESCRRIINSRPDFILLVRDKNSFELAKRHFVCEVRLCPDMAFAMRPERLLRLEPDPAIKALYLSRTDKESVRKSRKRYSLGLRVVDWLDEPRPKLTRLYAFCRRLERRRELRPWLPIQVLRYRVAEHIAQERLARGCRLLCKSRRVVTDRLHAMILGSMLGREVYAFDNSYGKLSSFYSTWRSYLPRVRFFESEGGALEAALS